MKKILLLVLAVLVVSNIAYAHETKTAGTVNVLYHTGQIDDPTAGQEEILYFSFDDSSNAFKIEDCDCKVSVLLDDKVVEGGKLEPTPDWGVNVGSRPVIFPSKGIYIVKVEGKSLTNKFKPFELSYDRRVEKEVVKEVPAPEETNNNFFSGTLLYVITGVIALGAVVVIRKYLKK
jgi:hypothetical protein